MGYSTVDVGELPAEGPGGAIRKVRRALGARAFGFNYFVLPPDAQGLEHDEGNTNQEEVVFVVRGSGRITIDGEEVELAPGRFVRIDPDSTRRPAAGPEGLEYVTFGAPLEGGYEPPSWG
jgi:mannose-6-phosphate isomerase-like protein (cupin superfamily)